MTILAIHTGGGLTKDMYENLRKEVNWEGNLHLVRYSTQHHLISQATFVLQRFGNQRINGTIF
jgi:hypothetical protein